MQLNDRNQMAKIWNLVSLAGLLICVALAFWAYKNGILDSVDTLQAFIAKFGYGGMAIFVLIQIVQVVIPILPGGISCLGGVIFFGPWLGFVYNYICFCYSLGDIVITPTEYSKGLLKSYGIQKKIYAVSNGVDTEFFQSRNKEKEKQELHEKYKIPMNRKVVVSAGHLIQRKGILDFLKLAKMMPETTFIWFGGGNDSLVTQEVKEAVKKKSENVIFAGYVEAEELRNAYCGADAFAFFSYEETEGIVVLEALACEVPVVLRDIPVYKGWIQDQMQAYKVHNLEEYKHNLMHIFKEDQEKLKKNARELAEQRSIRSAGEGLKVVYRLSGVNVLQSTHRGLSHRSVWKQEI